MSMVIAHTMPYLNFADVLQKQSTALHKLNCYNKTKYKKKVTQKHEHHTNINWSTGVPALPYLITSFYLHVELEQIP